MKAKQTAEFRELFNNRSLDVALFMLQPVFWLECNFYNLNVKFIQLKLKTDKVDALKSRQLPKCLH